MAKLYASKIRNKETNVMTEDVWSMNDVPERWRQEVQSILDEEI
jgi:hypothetical protein